LLLIILGGVLLGLLLLQGLLYRRLWDKGLNYTIRFSTKEAFEGDRVFLREELSNKKFLPLPWVFAKLPLFSRFTFLDDENMPVSDGARNSLFAIMGYTAMRRRKYFICNRRGVYNLHSASLIISNLLHTRDYTKEFRQKGELLVFPKLLENCPQINLLFKQLDAAILSNRIINPDPFEFRGLREYQPTDPLKAVNFRASAVAGQLMVNIHAPTAALRLVLVLNLEDMDAPTELHEENIRLCATIATRLINLGAGVGLHMSCDGKQNAQAKIAKQFSYIQEKPHVGTGAGQLYAIYERLARVNVGIKYAPMADWVNQLMDKELAFVFISSYQGADFLNAFHGLRERGVSAVLLE